MSWRVMRAVLLLLLGLGGLQGQVHAQLDSSKRLNFNRVGSVDNLDRLNRANLVNRPHWVDRVEQVAKKDSLKASGMQNKKQILFFPVISRSIETSWSFGVAGSGTFKFSKYDTSSRTSNLQGIVMYSLKKQFVAALNGTQYFDNEKYILNDQLSYSSFPDKFWGIGKYAPDTAVENYNFRQYYFYLHLMRHLGQSVYAGMIYEFQNLLEIGYVPGGLFEKQNIPGRSPYKVSGLGLSLTFDDRNNAFYPDKGVFAQVYFDHFAPMLGSDYTFTNLVADFRYYHAISKKNILALQAYSFSNLGNVVPLRSMAALGGMNSMRGFYAGRYHDKQQLVFQSEWRHSFNKRFGMALFGAIGDVGKDVADFSVPDLKYSYGAGLRYSINKSEKLNLRLDYGIGSGTNNNGFYLVIGEAF